MKKLLLASLTLLFLCRPPSQPLRGAQGRLEPRRGETSFGDQRSRNSTSGAPSAGVSPRASGAPSVPSLWLGAGSGPRGGAPSGRPSIAAGGTARQGGSQMPASDGTVPRAPQVPKSPASADKKAVYDLIRDAGDRILEVLKNDDLQQAAKKDKVIEVFDPLLDLPLMAKLTLGRKHWLKIDEEQRKQFTDLFANLLKTSYFEKLDLFTDETVEYEEPVPKKKKFHMLTYILSKDQRIEVAYKLYRKKQAWKVYDLEIEGVSIVKSYGSQYNEFLQDNAFDDLLEKMKEKIQSAKEKPKGKKSRKDKGESEDAKGAAD